MQGRACAYDLLQNPATKEVLLADSSAQSLVEARRFLKAGNLKKLRTALGDASDLNRVRKLSEGRNVVISAVPYFLNLSLAKVAIAAKAHFVDLGGNTKIVVKELALKTQAKKAGVTIIPDVGLGPGMTTTLAVYAMSQLDGALEVHIRDGGLPQDPKPPMNYLLTFSEHGLINEYVENATILENGRKREVPGLSGIESVDFPPPLGRLEAAHAAGGLSTMAETYEGKLKNLDCKLLRYPGHCEIINAMKAMGFFSLKKMRLDGQTLAPRDLSARLFRDHFHKPDEKDLVVIRITAIGLKNERRCEITGEMLDLYDEKTKMTAMMRTTGFPASIVAQMLAGKIIQKPGAYPVETGVPPQAFLREAEKRGFKPSWKQRWLD